MKKGNHGATAKSQKHETAGASTSTHAKSGAPSSTQQKNNDPSLTHAKSSAPSSTLAKSSDPAASTHQKNNDPSSTRAKSNDPASTHQKSNDPSSTRAKSNDPSLTHPKGSDPSSSHQKSSEPQLTKSEVVTIVEKTVSEALAQQRSEFQAEVTKSTSQQQLQDISDRLKNLGEKYLDADTKNGQRFKEVGDRLGELKQQSVQLEKLVKQDLDGIVEGKVRLELRKTRPDSELEDGDKKRWTEQLERSESIHQEEIQKLHQQHHQDMLSVINDCCRKLKTSFTRQNKPYDVNEIHNTIDDVEQKMVREILSEIEKTDTHEDLSSFEEALATSERSHEVGQNREVGQNQEFARLSSDDITASLNAFDAEDFGSSFSQDLESVADAVAAAEYAREPVVEENIEASRAMITGDRGNLYYTEELKRTVDDMIALGGGLGDTEKTGVSPFDTEPAPDLTEKLRTQSEVEASLESLIISGDAASSYEADVESLASKSQEEKKDKAVPVADKKDKAVPVADKKEKAVPVADTKLGGQSKASEVLPETTSMDLDQLRALEATVEDDFSWTDIQPPSSIEPEVPKVASREAVIQPAAATTPGKPSQDQDRLKSHDATKVEGEDFSWAGIPPSSKTDVGGLKSHEAVKQPASAASTKLPQDQDRGKTTGGKTALDKSAESAQDLDQMKELEAMLEAQMTDSPHAEGKPASKEQTEPTKSAKQQLKSNVSEQVTSSALPTTETANVTRKTGFEENPHYVEEVLGAASSKAKDKP